MREKINDPKIEEKILEILNKTTRSLSIKEVKEVLEEKYNIDRSPQVIKRYLLDLEVKEKLKQV